MMISVCMDYDLSKWENELKIQGTSTEEELSNQVDMITHSMES